MVKNVRPNNNNRTLIFAHSGIGALGSDAIIFGTKTGLKGYERLPKKSILVI